MITQIDKIDQYSIDVKILQQYADMLTNGNLVAFPTETVYGLGASALNPNAVAKIFEVKNRPSNNPLIAHISDIDMLKILVKGSVLDFKRLFDAFWPGALTIVLPKQDVVPDIVTANGSTVAVRCPSHPIANELIRLSGIPIVAPSANLSGRPSPTCFEHVYEDLNSKVSGIIDGGHCEIGIESTVIVPVGSNIVKILRPGAITPEMFELNGYKVIVDEHVLAPVSDNSPVESPGMLFKHYAPQASMQLVRGNDTDVIKYINAEISSSNVKCGVLCFDGEKDAYTSEYVIEYGNPNDPITLSKNLFYALRCFDKTSVKQIYTRVIEPKGLGLGIYNRLLRAASFNVIAL